MFPGFDGLMTLSRREGVDIRPTLLRVLTDLYVQTSAHTDEEARHFVELTSRLIDEVDDATRAAVRARLSIYPNTPPEIVRQLGLHATASARPVPLAPRIESLSPAVVATKPPTEAQLRMASPLTMQPKDASEIAEMFFAATASERAQILHNLAETPLKSSARIPEARAARAIETLHMAAFAADAENFALELGNALMLPADIAQRVVADAGGEPLACAAKALGMSSAIFQQVLMFLNPEFGNSFQNVYRLSRLYDVLAERPALIMVAAWRGATVAVSRAKYRPALYDDERNRARAAAPAARPAAQPGIDLANPTRNTAK